MASVNKHVQEVLGVVPDQASSGHCFILLAHVGSCAAYFKLM